MPKVNKGIGIFSGGYDSNPIGVELINVLESNREGFTQRQTGLVDAD